MLPSPEKGKQAFTTQRYVSYSVPILNDGINLISSETRNQESEVRPSPSQHKTTHNIWAI